MTLSLQKNQLVLYNEPFFLQGMNLFLDSFKLEKDPRKIYDPPSVSVDLIQKIVPYLKELGVNSVRIWPSSQSGRHCMQIPDEGIHKLGDAGFQLIMNLPVNWNLKPPLKELKAFLRRYSPDKFENVGLYCINNECYHGFFSPTRYIDAVHHLTKRLTGSLTLVTNANLNMPWYFGSDIIGADFFTYRYSISSQGYQDVGGVAKMFLEDARDLYPLIPGLMLKFFPLFKRYLLHQAKINNFDPIYFQGNLLKVLRGAQKAQKPYIVAEYGYVDDPALVDVIVAHMPWREMQGHVWYNWTNFDAKLQGKITNRPLFEAFKHACGRLGAYHAEKNKSWKEKRGQT